jgi:thiamine-monophosphate kinase
VQPFTNTLAESVGAWGEAKLITQIRRWLGSASPASPFGVGDDCAVLAPANRRQLITVDPVIYGRHFDDTVSPLAVGAKLLKRNLSDIAAMGGRPTAAVVALTLDPLVSQTWLRQFYRGLARCAADHRVPIVGGDIAESPGIFAASLTLLGQATGPRILTRVGARLGDRIYVTGVLGGSLASGHHVKFKPRLAEGAWLAAQPEIRAMMDLSDGLAKDLPALCPPGCDPALDPAAIPRRPGADLAQALTDGEDYELVFVLSGRVDHERFELAWSRKFPQVKLTCIGNFVTNRTRSILAVDLKSFQGYEHLQPRRSLRR